MKLGSSRKPISLAMVPSARPRNGKTMLSALSQNATRPDRLAHHFVLWGDPFSGSPLAIQYHPCGCPLWCAFRTQVGHRARSGKCQQQSLVFVPWAARLHTHADQKVLICDGRTPPANKTG